MVKEFKIESLSSLDGGSSYTPKKTQTLTNDEIIAGTGLFEGMVRYPGSNTGGKSSGGKTVGGDTGGGDTGGKNRILEIQKYLYETGLQNIFNDYNKQIANLDASKQKEIEDAYYVRELSKKYLGEYASNTGVGDVSGQLLDIYGNYQKNMNEINANFTELQTGLESSYNDKKNEYELGLLQTQMNIEMAEQQEQLEKELVEKSNTITNALKNTNSYKSQEEWDIYVDGLMKEESIDKQQADYLKGMYEVEQNTNFVLDNSINRTSDISYYNSDEDIVSKGNVYVSRNKETILAETKNVIDPSSELFERINKDYQTYDDDGKFIGDVGMGVPFPSGNKWYVSTNKDNEQVFVEYKISTNYNKLTGNTIISSSNESQKEMYDEIHKTLKGKDGNIQTPDGMFAYKYNSKTKEYTLDLNFKASGVDGEKGDFLINGVMYHIDKKNKVNGGGGMADLKNDFKKGNWKKGKDKEPQKSIANEMAEAYFGGDFQAFVKYVEDSRSGGKNKISNSNAMVIEYQRNYYTINDGELWQLSKK